MDFQESDSSSKPISSALCKIYCSVWFNTNNTLSKNGFLVNKGGIGIDTPGKNMNYGIWMNNKGNIIGGFETKNGMDYKVGTNKTYNDGKWHNVVITYNGNSELTFYRWYISFKKSDGRRNT